MQTGCRFVLSWVTGPWLTIALGASVGCAAEAEPTPRATAQAAQPTETPSEGTVTADPQRAEKLADLEMLCAALNRDYVDGTLSDYFKNVTPKTAWGQDLRKRGADADRPGRFLETQISALSAGAKDPGLRACRELLDYIDEVE